MKRLCSDEEDNETKMKELVRDPANAKEAILKELFGLPPDASIEDIINAPLLLPKLQAKELKETKLESLSNKFPVIPPEFISSYPGGEAYLKKGQDCEAEEEVVLLNLFGKKPGRPKKKGTKPPANTQSIHC